MMHNSSSQSAGLRRVRKMNLKQSKGFYGIREKNIFFSYTTLCFTFSRISLIRAFRLCNIGYFHLFRPLKIIQMKRLRQKKHC